MQYNLGPEPPPFFISISDESVTLFTDKSATDPTPQIIEINYTTWDSLVEWVEKVRRSAGIPDRYGKVYQQQPFLKPPTWDEIVPPKDL